MKKAIALVLTLGMAITALLLPASAATVEEEPVSPLVAVIRCPICLRSADHITVLQNNYIRAEMPCALETNPDAITVHQHEYKVYYQYASCSNCGNIHIGTTTEVYCGGVLIRTIRD